MIRKDLDGYGAKYEAKIQNFLTSYVVRRRKTSFSARLCAYCQILRSLPNTQNNVGTLGSLVRYFQCVARENDVRYIPQTSMPSPSS